MITTQTSNQKRSFAISINRATYFVSRHWLLAFSIFWGLFIILPWLAPVFMKVGATGIAGVIYFVYSLECHQLPERAYYLFGMKSMYSLAEIQAVWQQTNNPLILRQFIGNEQLGYKVAWCDRTTAMYGAIWLSMFFWKPLSKRVSPLPLWAFALFTLPVAIDGGSHFISDLMGLGVGFRETNTWLATLTGNTFPLWFYATDVIGSFNWYMRLITGAIFGIGLVAFAFPYFESSFMEIVYKIETKFRNAGLVL